LFCAELAKNLGCYVIAGYPERLNSQELDEISKSEAGSRPQVTESGTEIHQVGANSAALYDPDGIWVGGYRKSHLFKIDLSWAKAGKWTFLSQHSTWLSSWRYLRQRIPDFHPSLTYSHYELGDLHGPQSSDI
jgi:predicted amidohydrolase